jgi:Bacterial protein of unknown function (DUF899)
VDKGGELRRRSPPPRGRDDRYTQTWYSVRGVEPPVGGDMGHFLCCVRDGDRVFRTYSTTGRGVEPVNGSFGLLDMTPYGRRDSWEDSPDADGVATWGPTSRPVPRWARPGATAVETLGRSSDG